MMWWACRYRRFVQPGKRQPLSRWRRARFWRRLTTGVVSPRWRGLPALSLMRMAMVPSQPRRQAVSEARAGPRRRCFRGNSVGVGVVAAVGVDDVFEQVDHQGAVFGWEAGSDDHTAVLVVPVPEVAAGPALGGRAQALAFGAFEGADHLLQLGR